MTFAEKAALQEAVSRVEALTKVIERLNERVTAIEAHQSAETERRMDLSQRVTALESKPATLTLKDRGRG
jgi:hypothetical protein